MKNQNLEDLFKELEGHFDTGTPSEGHRDRFAEKLDVLSDAVSGNDSVSTMSDASPVKTFRSKKTSWWKPLSIAASLALLCTLGLGIYASNESIGEQVADISPEVSRTEFYFAGLIEEQVKQIESQSSPQTRQLIDDTMVQLEKLKEDHKRLEQDLVNGGNSKLILNAMITNFRTRIDLLQEVIDQIETINKLNQYDDTKTTI